MTNQKKLNLKNCTLFILSDEQFNDFLMCKGGCEK